MVRGATDTRERILKAAGSLYSNHGCEGTTLDDILTASGITKGAFYHYFKSKDALGEALVERIVSEYRFLAEAIDPATAPFDQLESFLGELVRLNQSGQWINCKLILRMSTESHVNHPATEQRIKKFWRWYEGFFVELIETCIKEGSLSRKFSAETQAKLLMSTMAGVVTFENVPGPKHNINEIMETLIKLLRA